VTASSHSNARAHQLRTPVESMGPALALPGPRSKGAAPFDAAIRPPGSKSLTNRALLLASLASGESVLRGALIDADDAQRMIVALRMLGATIDVSRSPTGDEIRVRGVGGLWRPADPDRVVLNLNNAGTATRFLAAAALRSPVPVVIDGNDRMRQRPIAELAEMLRLVGSRIKFLGDPACPPIEITPPPPVSAPPCLEVQTTRSSQFVSALLLVAPWLHPGLTIKLTGEITSASYIQMTLGLLERVGASVRTGADLRVIRVGPPPLTPGQPPGLAGFDYDVEPDASGATYWWAAAALCPRARCRVLGLDGTSLQGDSDFTDLLARAGATVSTSPADRWIAVTGPDELSGVMADMSDMPDAAMTMMVVAAFARGTSVLRGLKTLRVKESDRIEAMRSELAKIGVVCESPVFGDAGAMTITPPASAGGVDCSPAAAPVAFDTYDDHRIAMSLALVSLRRPNVTINHPACVAKTYPEYWRHFADLLGL